ncbi:MAG: hypothetical protein KAH32_08660, partial [Chlamydiia bacterium]|nr:hypothetical protein [Chlamydiia bacterium]
KTGALLVGTGVTCNDVTLTAMPTIASGGSSTNPGSFWRELGMPFNNNIKVNEITWGTTYNDVITGVTVPDYSHINAWDATAGNWTALTGGDNLPTAVEVYLKGGEKIIIPGIDLAQHNSNFSMHVSPNGGGNWNFIPNPYLSNLSNIGGNLITPNVDLLDGFLAGYLSVLVVDGPGAGTYKTVYSNNSGTLNKSNLSVLQGFWVEVVSAGNFTISSAAQSASTSGNLPLSKNNLDNQLPPNVSLSLFNETASESTLDAMARMFVNENESTVTDGNKRLYDASTLNTYPNKVASMFLNRGENKLGSYDIFRGDLESNTIVGDLSLIGKTDGDYKISISEMTIDAGYNVYLVDKQENTTHLLNTSDYSFTHASTNEANRFEIQITTETLGES